MRDDVTLRQSLMTTGFNEQRQRDLNALAYEDRQKGNSGYYLPARVELEIRDTHERAQALYDACCEVWEIHGLKRTRAFYRAVFDNCLQSLTETRRSVVASELQDRDTLLRTPGGSSAAQGSLKRRMDQLRATWSQKLEKETRDSETRERVERERAVLITPPQIDTTRADNSPQGNRRMTTLTNKQVSEIASTFTWKELESQFSELQTKVEGQKFTVTFMRTKWESGDVSEKWIVGGSAVLRKKLEYLSSVAARKLGHSARTDANEYWLNHVRQWMQQEELDKDRRLAWLTTGATSNRGAIGTTENFSTQRISEVSAMFCMDLIALGTPDAAISQTFPATTDSKVGRRQKRSSDFEILAARLWKQKKASNGRVSVHDLEAIGTELDSQKFIPPAKFLEGKAALELKTRNSKNANSKSGGAIQTWSALITRGDKYDIRAMRKLLHRCAAKQP